MRHFTHFIAMAAVSTAALVAATGGANAGAFAIREQSAVGQGLSFAGAAAGSAGLNSIFWNPATITMKPGFQTEFALTAVIPEAKITPIAGTSPFLINRGSSGDIGEDALVPSGSVSYQLNDRLWLGLYTGAPFGFTTKPNYDWAGQIYSRTSRVFSFNATPVVAYKVNDWLSLAAGVQIQYMDVRLRSATSFLPGARSGTLEGDDTSFGYTLGATITPFAGTEIGIGFRSSIRQELDGDLTIPVGATASAIVPVKATVNLPETVSVGLRQAVNDRWTVSAGFEWTNWSRLKDPRVVNQLNGTVAQVLHFNYDDGWFASIGAEYKLNPNWTFRAGVAYEWSPIDEKIRSTRLPDNDRIWASIGASYAWNDKLTFDIGYTHIFSRDTKIRIAQGHQDLIVNPILGPLPFVGDVDSRVDIIAVGMRYRWDEPSKPIPAPIVRKY
ncbi:outer membrane protein transport protein [Chelatococcus sp. SYSU_G07232]|uniref:Outer membrane protein transport protein n=1 Tax=Chelatococcus albus TaxID=3047466 RepID=A0ABT7AE61_9HYPH|nr:outer membrane protein transport protein [Chelatococcus sp. SYSU_G07232]MDJ1156896.1 outer membrane protein transport protein [Chelatococcus sp. SYSU_G07232]